MTEHSAGIVGYPLAHSISPAFQQAAFDYYKLGVRFETWETPSEKLHERVAAMRSPNLLGASVTVPYKATVIPLLDRLSDSAQRVGAVNLIVNRSGQLDGYNTDATGFLRALLEDGSFDPVDKRVLILGAGGAARAVTSALLDQGVAMLTVANRTLERASRLVADLGSGGPIHATSFESPGLASDRDWDLIVNCTTLGMRHSEGENDLPIPSDWIISGSLVCDIVYNPLETPLLREAEKRGARTLSGISMLVYQGAEAFELWTEREAPLHVMFQAARQALVS